MAETPLLECKGVSKAFGAVQALYRVDFEVRGGEVMALVGDNGAGKSTLIKGIVGIYPFDEGEVRFEGKAGHIHGPRDAARLGIEVVYQDLALADNLDVVANMFLGRERIRNGIVLDESSMERSSRETLDSLHVTTLRSVRQIVAGLSGGQRQAVAVAKSVHVELEARHPRRADGRARRGPDPTGARPRAPARRARARRRGHLAQPPRHLRGRRPDHGAAAGPAGGRVRAGRDDAAGGRPRDHGRARSTTCPGWDDAEAIATDDDRGPARPDAARRGRAEVPRENGGRVPPRLVARGPRRGARVAPHRARARRHLRPLRHPRRHVRHRAELHEPPAPDVVRSRRSPSASCSCC